MIPFTCSKCHKEKVKIHGQICVSCQIEKIEKHSPPKDASNEELISYYTEQRVLIGCRECGARDFAYEAGIKIENFLKYFVMFIQCKCGESYMDLLEVREMRLQDVGIEESE